MTAPRKINSRMQLQHGKYLVDVVVTSMSGVIALKVARLLFLLNNRKTGLPHQEKVTISKQLNRVHFRRKHTAVTNA